MFVQHHRLYYIQSLLTMSAHISFRAGENKSSKTAIFRLSQTEYIVLWIHISVCDRRKIAVFDYLFPSLTDGIYHQSTALRK